MSYVVVAVCLLYDLRLDDAASVAVIVILFCCTGSDGEVLGQGAHSVGTVLENWDRTAVLARRSKMKHMSGRSPMHKAATMMRC